MKYNLEVRENELDFVQICEDNKDTEAIVITLTKPDNQVIQYYAVSRNLAKYRSGPHSLVPHAESNWIPGKNPRYVTLDYVFSFSVGGDRTAEFFSGVKEAKKKREYDNALCKVVVETS